MFASASLPRLLLIGTGLCCGAGGTAPLAAAFWKPVSSEELAQTRPAVDPESGVEILFRETAIDDSDDEWTRYHSYVRLKVFDARGVAALDKIEILETRGAPAINVAARVVRPDGTVVPVERDTIHAREIVRHGALRVRAKAFSPPALEPGCIVEYQWEEESEHSIAGLQLYFQDRFPAARVRFRIKPFNYERRGYQVFPAGFRYAIPELRTDPQGFYLFEQASVPALREEPWMPPEDMVQSWMVLYFLRRGQKAEQFWRDTGRDLAQQAARLTPTTREVAAVAGTLTHGAVDDADKLRRLAVFCRDEVANPAEGRHPGLDARATGAVQWQSAPATLASRAGTATEINLLFLALARACGFEVRLACAADRSKRLFREPLPARFMLPDHLAAVRTGGSWRFFDPGNRFVAVGQLAWKNEGVAALICDRAASEFVETPRTPRAESGVNRTARLTLDASGAAIGIVTLEHRGHAAAAEREQWTALTSEQIAWRIYEAEIARWPGFELGEITVEQLDHPDQPLVVSYPVRVPHYATMTGTRLVFPLAFFQQRRPPVFTHATREHVIYLPYEFEEEDVVELGLPSGFEFEETGAPAAFALPPAVEYRSQLVRSDAGDRLWFRRTVAHGGMLFPASTYRLLKRAFDDLHRRDGQVGFGLRRP